MIFAKIDELMNSMNNYRRTFTVYDGDKTYKKVHTWKDPYPEMYFKKNDKKNENEEDKEKNKKKEEEEKRMRIIKENLTCFMLKLNYIDDPEILLGYPIVKSKGLGKDKIELYPIPELLTYDGYIAQIGKQDTKLDYYFNTKFKSANNEFYNFSSIINQFNVQGRLYAKIKTTNPTCEPISLATIKVTIEITILSIVILFSFSISLPSFSLKLYFCNFPFSYSNNIPIFYSNIQFSICYLLFIYLNCPLFYTSSCFTC